MSREPSRSSTDKIDVILKRLERETAKVALATGLRCESTCGACCRNPKIEAMVCEMMPLARSLVESGTGEKEYFRAKASVGQVCTMYQPTNEDGTQGYCRAYRFRPSVCRAFGFAGVRNKSGPALWICKVHKQDQPDRVSAAQAAVESGAIELPMAADFVHRLAGVEPSPALTTFKPINQAIAEALERCYLRPDHDPEASDPAETYG